MCERFIAIELACRARLDAAYTVEQEKQVDKFREDFCNGQGRYDWPVFNSVCTTPGSFHAAAVALASAITMFNTGEAVALRPTRDPDLSREDRRSDR